MTLDEALQELEITGKGKIKQLADILGITDDAIYQWDKNRIPPRREHEVRHEANLMKASKNNTLSIQSP